MSQIVDGERNGGREVIGGEIEASQTSQESEMGGEGGRESIILEVEVSEEG